MIEISTIGVWGFEGAIRGMRFPYESNYKSDSEYKPDCNNCNANTSTSFSYCGDISMMEYCPQKFVIGDNDMTLAKKLIKGGSEHRKFLRMIHTQAEIRAPRYWWAEMDKYKFVEANSSSTMHLITKRELTYDDFSYDKTIGKETVDYIIEAINCRIEAYNKKGSDGIYVYPKEEREQFFREIKQLLPESYNQLRMIDTNYECLLNIYRQRKNHRLSEWREFCSWIESLPYMKEFINA